MIFVINAAHWLLFPGTPNILKSMKFFRIIGLMVPLIFVGCESPGNLAFQFQAETGVRWEGLAGFKTEARETSVPGARVLQGVRGDDRVRILFLPIANESEVPEKVKYHRRILESSFATVPSPYAAVVSNKVGCDDRFRPKERIRGGVLWLSYGANDRLASGACTKESVQYRGHMAFFRAGTQLLKLEYFSLWSDEEDEKMAIFIDQAPSQLLLRMPNAKIQQ